MKIQSFKILKGKAFVAKIVILLLVLLVIGCGAIFYINTRDRVINTEVTSEQLELLTKEWKIYTNEKFGYEMKYPMSWNMSENIIYANHEDCVFCPPELTSPGGECEPKDTIGHMPDTLAPILFFQSAISETDSKNPAHKVLGKKDGYKYFLVLANPLFEKEFNIMALTFQFKSSKIAPSPTPASTIKVPSITVLSPNGGEVWVRNSYNTISWDVSNKTESTLFDIKLVRKNSTSPATTAFIQEGQSSSQNKYLWKTGDTYSTMFVPSTGDSTVEFPGAGQYVIQVCIHQTDNCDSSDANFTFKEPSVRVIAPNNSGLQLVSGSAYQIKWEYFNATNTSQVDLYLKKINDFDCYNSIKSLDCSLSNRSSEIILDKNIPSNTAYYWVVGTDIANKPINPGDYRMKICVAGTADCDVASLYFYIKPSPTQPHITVISPNGGELFDPGSRVPIIWKDNANYSKVKIMVVAGRREDGHYTNNGSMGTYRGYTIYEGENTGKLDWVVPMEYPGSGKYLIRIDPQDGVGSVGYSDDYFTILKSTNSSPRIEPSALPNAPVTSYYSQELEVIGFATSTVNWQIVGGSLPPGLHIQNQYVTCPPMFPSNCPHIDIVMFKARISGKPTQAGNYNFTVKASNETQSVTKTYSLNLY